MDHQLLLVVASTGRHYRHRLLITCLQVTVLHVDRHGHVVREIAPASLGVRQVHLARLVAEPLATQLLLVSLKLATVTRQPLVPGRTDLVSPSRQRNRRHSSDQYETSKHLARPMHSRSSPDLPTDRIAGQS